MNCVKVDKLISLIMSKFSVKTCYYRVYYCYFSYQLGIEPYPVSANPGYPFFPCFTSKLLPESGCPISSIDPPFLKGGSFCNFWDPFSTRNLNRWESVFDTFFEF